MTTQRHMSIAGPASCLGTAARILDRSLTGIYDEALRAHGLRITQMALLVVLKHKGEATATDLASLLCFEKSTLSRSVDRLIDNGWVAVGDAEDSRVQPLRLTPSGKRLLEKAMPAWEEAQERARDVLGENRSNSLSQSAQLLINRNLATQKES